MSKLKMNCGYCGRKCDLDKDFCIPQDSVYVCKSCYEWQKRVSNSETKLAENEKENMELASKVDLLESEKENLFRTLEEANEEYQDKISFCIEQLEKVKELLYPELRFDYSLYLRVMHEIDNQIKQLKEME